MQNTKEPIYCTPKFSGKTGYFETRFIELNGNEYALIGTDRIGSDYMLTLKNIKTNEIRSIKYDTVVGWFK